MISRKLQVTSMEVQDLKGLSQVHQTRRTSSGDLLVILRRLFEYIPDILKWDRVPQTFQSTLDHKIQGPWQKLDQAQRFYGAAKKRQHQDRPKPIRSSLNPVRFWEILIQTNNFGTLPWNSIRIFSDSLLFTSSWFTNEGQRFLGITGKACWLYPKQVQLILK